MFVDMNLIGKSCMITVGTQARTCRPQIGPTVWGKKKIVQVFRLITINSIEEQLISLQAFKKYISNNVVDTSKIHEDKVNLNSVMQSFEEFSKDKINLMKEKNKDKNKKMSKYEELLMDDENEMKQEMEIEYLQKLVES